MLQSIRDRLTGPLVWFVVGLIAIPFAFWGIDSFNTGGGDPVLVEVGDQEITQNQFRQNYEQRYQQYRSLMGENFRADLFDENQFRQLTLENMVQESALRQFARDAGYRASDAMLRDFLVTIPAFQKDGKFSAETYRDLLQRQNLPVDRYEAQLRESLVLDQLRSAVQDTSFVTADEAWSAFRLQNQTREAAVAVIAASDFADKVEISDDEIAAYFDANKDRFRAPERVRVRYVELDRNRLPVIENPDPEVLRSIYDVEREARFTVPEERKARHILFNFGADKDAARAKADDALRQLQAGADFAALAESLSDDPGSKSQGGDLGWVRKGMMVPAFEQALFAAASGALIGPVETEFGWHIVRADEIRAEQIRPFEDADVQADLLEVYRGRENEERFRELSEKLEQAAFENTSLEPVADAVGLPIQTSEWFARSGGAGVAASKDVQQAAFSPEVLDAGENSRPLANGPNALVVLSKESYEPARQRALDEVRDQVRASLASERAVQRARESADRIAAAVNEGQTLAQALEAHGLKPRFEGVAARGQAELGAALGDELFAMPRPPEGKVGVRVGTDSQGNPAVLVLKAVNDMQRDLVEADVQAALRTRLRESSAGSEFAAYHEAVEEAVKVKIKRPLEVTPATPLEP